MEAVAHCHKKGISHRDIKLENVIYASPGVVKLIDFGFAIATTGSLKTFCGTPTYMSPELVRKNEYFGPNVDKWALGVLLYRMVTGLYPFRGKMLNVFVSKIDQKLAQKDRELYRKIYSGVYDQRILPSNEVKDVISKL